MENWNQHGKSCFTKDEEFDEEDVWSTTATETRDFVGHYNSSGSSSSSSLSSRRFHSSPRKIPGNKSETKKGQRSSAPSNIQDWSKINGIRGTGSWVDDDLNDGHKVQNFDEDDDGEVIPPHEWIEKKLAGTQISSSVYEGIGRTLKGRDLSQLRNAILTKTGFLE